MGLNEDSEQERAVASVHGICKAFPGVKALGDVSLDVLSGEVHALVGENGAGKSTLMMILSGVIQPDEGGICIDGRDVRIRDSAEAKRLGIGTVFQELSLVPGLSVAENILAHHLPTRCGIIDRRLLKARARAALARVGIDIDPDRRLGSLSIANRQLVEIAKALAQSTRLLVLDEPTSSLTFAETQRLVSLVKGLRTEGIGILFISHKMSEVFAVADRISVMREGRMVATLEAAGTSPDEVVSLMAGRAIADARIRQSGCHEGEALRTERLTLRPRFSDVSMSLQYGEVVGLAGLKGAGRSELAQALFGLDSIDSGTYLLDGREVSFRSPYDAMSAGIGYVPEDRKEEGLFLGLSVWENIAASSLGQFTSRGVLQRKWVRGVSETFRDSLAIRTPSLDQMVQNLSGGNQQKVLLAKWLACNPRVLIIDEPTRGVDVGSRADLHNLIRELADGGTAVMVISSDTSEIIALSDRVYVMADGRMAGELSGAGITEEAIMRLATEVRFGAGKAVA